MTDKILDDIKNKSSVLGNCIYYLKYHDCLSWLGNLAIEVEVVDAINHSISAYTNINNTTIENGVLSGKITIEIPMTLKDEQISTLRGVIKHELLHLYQYRTWKSLSSSKYKVQEASRYGYDKDFQNSLVTERKLEMYNGFPLFTKKASNEDKAGFYINYLGYRLNPLETPAFCKLRMRNSTTK